MTEQQLDYQDANRLRPLLFARASAATEHDLHQQPTSMTRDKSSSQIAVEMQELRDEAAE